MPITEKTVELNVTSEVLNYLAKKYGRPFYALGPSTRAESRLGFDVSIEAPGRAFLIQYKRAYVTPSGALEWRLNRTSLRDQHAKLQRLEGLGLSVFYAFPKFSTALELSSNRYRLLLETFWRRPLAINPAGGPVGHHAVRWDPSTGVWTVRSDQPTPIAEPPTSYDAALSQVFGGDGSGKGYAEVARIVNSTMLGADFPEGNERPEATDEGFRDDFEGLSIVGWTDDAPP